MPNPTKVSWTPPTTNVDGSPIAAGEITGYQVGIRLASGTAGVYTILAPVDPASAVSDLFSEVSPPLTSGSYFCAVQTLSTSAGNSAWSVEVPFTITSPPNPPSNPTIA